jgi:hypothetical protein
VHFIQSINLKILSEEKIDMEERETTSATGGSMLRKR